MNQLLSDIEVFMEDAIVTMQVHGIVAKADAYKLLGQVQAALAEPLNSSTNGVEPIGEIVQAFGDLTAVSIPVMPPVGTKLYASPLKSEWVSLTNEQIAESVGSPLDEVYLADFRKVEAKLKEKNT